MVQTIARGKYQAVSLPSDFVKQVRNHVKKHKNKYRSIAQFTEYAVSEQMLVDNQGLHIRPPKFQEMDILKELTEIKEMLKKK